MMSEEIERRKDLMVDYSGNYTEYIENSGEKQTVVFTNNTIQGSNDKNEFEGVNISKKGNTAVVLGSFTIKGNTTGLKYRHHKNVTMSDGCSYDTDITGFAFEKEN